MAKHPHSQKTERRPASHFTRLYTWAYFLALAGAVVAIGVAVLARRPDFAGLIFWTQAPLLAVVGAHLYFTWQRGG